MKLDLLFGFGLERIYFKKEAHELSPRAVILNQNFDSLHAVFEKRRRYEDFSGDRSER